MFILPMKKPGPREVKGSVRGCTASSEPNHSATRPWLPGPHPELKRFQGAEGRGYCGGAWGWPAGVPARACEEEAAMEEPELRLLQTASPAHHTQAPHDPGGEPLRQPPPRLVQPRSVDLELPQTHQALPNFQEHCCSLGHTMGSAPGSCLSHRSGGRLLKVGG